MRFHTAYLGFGASLGDRLENLRVAIRGIDHHEAGTRVEAVSSIYESAHLGLMPDDSARYPQHLNCVARIETVHEPLALLELTQEWETRGGRQHLERWGPRSIDIDILLYDSLTLQTERLTLPHPALAQRAFVVVPLCELEPDLRLPCGQTIADLCDSPIIRDQPIERIPTDELLL